MNKTSLSKNLLRFLCVTVFLTVCTSPVQAIEAMDPRASADLVTTIDQSASSVIMKRTKILQYLGSEFKAYTNIVAEALNSNSTERQGKNKKNMPFYEDFLGVLTDNVLSRFGAIQVRLKTDEIMRETTLGYSTVQSAGSNNDSANPATASARDNDSYLYEKLVTFFCMPGAADAPADCAKTKAAMGLRTGENFIDFFLNDRTWSDKTVLDVMQLARRMFFGATGRLQLGYETQDRENFVSSAEPLARNNLRMAILNDLASRRAPVSSAGRQVLGIMLKILAKSSGTVSTTDIIQACDTKNLVINDSDNATVRASKTINNYVCSHTNTPTGGGPRIISLAAIDKVMQHDIYLSPNFYDEINAGYNNDASLARMEVFIKAQQVAQDYRALRLLQMKTAAVAMKMMNK